MSEINSSHHIKSWLGNVILLLSHPCLQLLLLQLSGCFEASV